MRVAGCFWCFLVLSAVAAQGKSLLDSAWQEYEYQNFPVAERIFDRIARESGADDRLQARIGLALLAHYRMPGGNPKKALGMYREIVAELDSGHAFVPTLLVNMGKASMELADPDTAAARACFESVMQRYPGTVEADQAALERAQMMIYVQDSLNFRQAIAFAEDYLARFPDNTLSGTFQGFCGRLYLFLKDYASAQKSLIRLYESGRITNMYEIPTVLFQIAWISESKLNDYETAKKYYRTIINEHSIDSRLYVCELRLKALEELTGERQ